MTKHFKSPVPVSRPPDADADVPHHVPVPDVSSPVPDVSTPISEDPTPDPTPPPVPVIDDTAPPQPRRSSRVRQAPERLADKMSWGTKSYDSNTALKTDPSSISDKGHFHHWYPGGGGGFTGHAHIVC